MTIVEEQELDKDARMWATFCHLTGLLSLTGIPFAGFIGPLILWLLKKGDDPFIDDQGREAVNFQISMGIYTIIAGFLCLILIGYPLLGVLWLAEIIFIIVACVKSNDGEAYRYPLTIRLL